MQGEEMFGTLTLRDVPRSLLITAFQLDNGRGTSILWQLWLAAQPTGV